MNRKIAYVVDSTLVKDAADIEGTDIFFQPLHVMVDDKTFDDVTGISVDEFYKYFNEGADCSTSQPSPGGYAATYEKLRDAGYTEALVVTLSSKLSGTYSSATQAADLVDGFTVKVIDSGYITSAVTTVLKHTIAHFADQPDVTLDELGAFCSNIFATMNVYVYIGDLDSLKKGGRLSGAQAMVGKLLQIKPIITIVDGALEVVAKERTLKRSINKVAELAAANDFNHALVLGTNNIELRDQLAAACREKFGDVPVDFAGLSPVIGVHVGSDATAVITWSM